MNLWKMPLFKCQNPFTGELVPVRIVEWDRARKVARVVDPAGDFRHVPFSYFLISSPSPSSSALTSEKA